MGHLTLDLEALVARGDATKSFLARGEVLHADLTLAMDPLLEELSFVPL
jgi:hypothetical protein